MGYLLAADVLSGGVLIEAGVSCRPRLAKARRRLASSVSTAM
jgi:hypothetical protein